jgi:hypothetical protein
MKICFPLGYIIFGSPETITVFGHKITIPGHPVTIIRWVCIEIPLLIEYPIFIPKPDPEQIIQLGNWLNTNDVNPAALGELRVLATIAHLSNKLISPDLQGLFQESLTKAVAQLDLPIEARVTLNRQVIREHSIPNVVDNSDGIHTNCE